MHAFVNVSGRTKMNMFYKTKRRESERVLYIFYYVLSNRKSLFDFSFYGFQGRTFLFSSLFFVRNQLYFFPRVLTLIRLLVRLYIYFHVFTFFFPQFFVFIYLSFLRRCWIFFCEWISNGRVARFSLFVPKINFSSLFCLLLICTFPQNGASTIKRIPTKFCCPFVWIVGW